MKLAEVVRLLDATVVSRNSDLRMEIRKGGAADLMSDVLAFNVADGVLLTGLTNPQAIRTAEVAGVIAVVFVRGKLPPQETQSLAEEAGIPLVATDLTMFDACGRLYEAGLRYSDEKSSGTKQVRVG